MFRGASDTLEAMAYALYFDEKNKLLRIVHTGELSDPVVREVIEHVERFETRHDVKIGVLDFSQVTSIKNSAEFIKGLATGPSHYEQYYMVSPKDAQFGMSRMFQILRGEFSQVHVMRTLEELHDKLKVDLSQAKLIYASEDFPKTDNAE